MLYVVLLFIYCQLQFLNLLFFLQDIKWPNEWLPRIVFFNALKIEKMEKNRYLFYEPGNEIPFAKETYRIKGYFRENLELWDFPFDCQVLYFTLFTSCICFIALLGVVNDKCETFREGETNVFLCESETS